MIIKSNPFLRNDYYPDQNDIDDLNTRINEVQSDVDLLAISVNEKAEAVNGRLNNLQNDYNESFETEALKANTADFNVLNVNVQATIRDLNAENTYIENLIVNKPVQDLSLRTPHLENTTSLNGNFYAPNILGGNLYNATLVNPTFEELDTVNANSLNVNSANVAELFVNTNSEPITSNAILGYDSNGRVIPIKAPVELPENANYIFTDEHGTALPGKAETEVNASDNLITSNAVKNVTDNLASTVDYLKNVLNVVLSLPATNVSGWNNSESPLNIQGMTDFVIFPFSGGSTSGADVGNGARLDFDSASNVATLYIPGLKWTMGNMDNTFDNCRLLNKNILISDGVTRMDNTFANCFNLNQDILIPNSVKSMYYTFASCTNLNQNILIPNSVEYIQNTFRNCTNLNQNILIPDGAAFMDNTFENCTNLNQNILIPNSVKYMDNVFANCKSLNQNIFIPNSVKSMYHTFVNCRNLNQNILIPGSVRYMDNVFKNCTNLNISDMYIYSQNIGSIDGAFNNCNRIGNIHIPTSVPKVTSNYIYNSLVNGYTGITFAPENIINDLPVDPIDWPPIN